MAAWRCSCEEVERIPNEMRRQMSTAALSSHSSLLSMQNSSAYVFFVVFWCACLWRAAHCIYVLTASLVLVLQSRARLFSLQEVNRVQSGLTVIVANMSFTCIGSENSTSWCKRPKVECDINHSCIQSSLNSAWNVLQIASLSLQSHMLRVCSVTAFTAAHQISL